MGWLGGVDVDILSNNPEVQQSGAWMKGAGLGWRYGSATQPFSTYLSWTYVYAPPETKSYDVTPHFSFRGNYESQSLR